MSDILLYNVIAENQRLQRAYVTKSIDPSAPDSLSYYSSNNIGSSYNQYIFTVPNQVTGLSTLPISTCPPMVRHWRRFLSPLTCPKANGFKVCDASGYFRCGNACSWTVPAGVTCVQFQIWGHGAGNSGQCCCGGTPFGPTGSYMTVCTSVTPGEVFCLCSGCAYCCYATQTTPPVSAVNSYVCSGSGGFFALAMGATACICLWRQAIPGVTSSGCQMPSNDGCAPESCAGWNFCWDTAADNTCTSHAFSINETWCLCCNTRSAVAYGLPVIYPGLSVGTVDVASGPTFTISPPVFGFENCTCCHCWQSSFTMPNGYGGCYFQAINGYQAIPAVGGYGGFVCGGQNASGGDAGGMGMICVSWA